MKQWILRFGDLGKKKIWVFWIEEEGDGRLWIFSVDIEEDDEKLGFNFGKDGQKAKRT